MEDSKSKTDDDEYLNENNIKEELEEDNILNEEQLAQVTNNPKDYHEYDDEEEEEIIMNNKSTKNVSNNNNKDSIKNSMIQKPTNKSSDSDLLKKESKEEENLNINQTIDETQKKINEDKICDSSNDIKFNLNNKNSESFHSSENNMSLSSSEIAKKPSNKNNQIKKNFFVFKDNNVCSYNESEESFSKSFINKSEEDIINVDMNPVLLSSLEKAYPALQSNDLKKIYKYLKDENYFQLTIFEIMNVIQREVSIKITEKKYNNENYNNDNDFGNYTFNFPMELVDSIDTDYINSEHLLIMKYYKTMNADNKNDCFEAKEITEDFLYDKNMEKQQKRRKVIKYLDGSYNYIPQMCSYNDECNKEGCIYAHNEYEINYHPLFYKTKYFIDSNYCESNMALCPTANNLDEDFRIIYNYKDSDIIDVMNILKSECKNTKKRIKSVYNKIKNFDLKTFKIFKCNNSECNKDPHLCYKYHKIMEKRRPPYLYRYINEICENIENNQKCEKGDFCNKCHTSYEFNYHKLNFQKLVFCNRNIKNGKCEFIDTCYGFHDYNNEITKKNIIKEEIENKIQKLKKDYNIDIFKCQKCIRIYENFIFYYLKCKHILCKKCFNKSKSDKKCPLCKKSFSIGDETLINFKESAKNIDESQS